MYFIATKSIITTALNNAILKGTLLVNVRQTEDSIVFENNDESTAIRINVTKEIDPDLTLNGTGEFTANSQVLLSAFKGIDTDMVRVDKSDVYVVVKGDKSKTKINTVMKDISGDNFVKPSIKLEIETKMIIDIINSVAFAVSGDTLSRPVLTGVNLNYDGMVLTAIATDSYRLAVKEYDIPFGNTFSITLPARSLLALKTLFTGEKLTMYIDERIAIFEDDVVTYKTTLLSGKYPDVERLIPTEFEQKMSISRVDLLSSLNRILFIKTDQKSIVKLVLNDEEKTLYASNQEIGEASERLDDVEFEGPDLSVSFDASYMKDALEGLNGDVVEIKFSGDLKPFTVTDGDNATIQLLLPVRTLS